jgi:hypothetical protein
VHNPRSGQAGPTAARLAVAVALALVASLLGPAGVLPAGADGPYGPDTCLWGFVWREARPSDHVCVTPAVRSQTATDNALAASRRSPTGGTWGPDTCLAGFVWRGAYPGDTVCVPPATRTQAADDNARAAERRARDTYDGGHAGFPFPTDCVQGGITAFLMEPDGSFTFAGDLVNADLLPNGVCRPGRRATVICAAPLLDGGALWFSHSAWIPSPGPGVTVHRWSAIGTDARIAENWTKLPRRGLGASDLMGGSLCGLADTRSVAEITSTIHDLLHLTKPVITISAT